MSAATPAGPLAAVLQAPLPSRAVSKTYELPRERSRRSPVTNGERKAGEGERGVALTPTLSRKAGEGEGSRAGGQVFAGGGQHLARLGAVGRADDAVALHLLDHARSAVVADLQPPLDVRDRRLARVAHDRNRLIV